MNNVTLAELEALELTLEAEAEAQYWADLDSTDWDSFDWDQD